MGLVGLGGCVQAVADHCGNNGGDVACRERFPDGSAPYCWVCTGKNHGCGDQPPTEEACIPASESGTPASTSTSVASTSSSEGGTMTGTGTSETTNVDSGSSTTMTDPVPVCGNGVAEGDEKCDGTDVRDLDCEALNVGCSSLDGAGSDSSGSSSESGCQDGEILCADDCMSYELGNCAAEELVACNNGQIEGNEQCEGANLNGGRCDLISGFSGGQLACDPVECMFDTSGCDPCALAGGACSMMLPCCEGAGLCGLVSGTCGIL